MDLLANENTAGADASVEALKLYNMKLAPVVEIYLLCSLARTKKGNDRP